MARADLVSFRHNRLRSRHHSLRRNCCRNCSRKCCNYCRSRLTLLYRRPM